MIPSLANLVLVALISAGVPADENPVFKELLEKGITMSDGSTAKLPPPIMADGLDAAGQRAILDKLADARNTVDQIVTKSYYAPVVVKVGKVRTAKPSKGEGPVGRTVDVWFVAHGDWNMLCSKDFLETVMKTKDEGKSQVVSKSGALTGEEMDERELTATSKEGYEERFVYATFSLFDRVELSATRFAVLQSGKDYTLAAAHVDPRFDKDPEYPNQWRALLRNEQAKITPGPPHLFAHAGGYAKITRLNEPADAVFIECHLVYEEPYDWFDGVNLVGQKAPVMVREKIKTFRRKLSVASEEKKNEKE